MVERQVKSERWALCVEAGKVLAVIVAIGCFLFTLAVLVAGCDLFGSGPTCRTARWGYAIAGDPYVVTPTVVTPGGIHYDASGMTDESALLDRLTQEVSDCLQTSIDRSSFVVKIASDWTPSCTGDQQMLHSIAPQQGCSDKGLMPDPKCPCHWRAIVQCPNVIVATPSLYLYKDALTRFVTGSQNPWADAKLAVCASPSTAPMSLGIP